MSARMVRVIKPKQVCLQGIDSIRNLPKYAQLARDYPEVEFGLRWDVTKAGKSGYPTQDAMRDFAEVLPNVSLHLFGAETFKYVISNRHMPDFTQAFDAFSRIQINAGQMPDEHPLPRVVALCNLVFSSMKKNTSVLINDLTRDSAYQWALNMMKIKGDPDLSYVYQIAADGEDIRVDTPIMMAEQVRYRGFSGNITKANVLDVIDRISEASSELPEKDYFLNIFSACQVNGEFSTHNAREILELVYPRENE